MKVHYHTAGEIWKLNSSPLDASKISTCYNKVLSENSCIMQTAILKLPESERFDKIENLETLVSFDTESYGTEIRTTDFHPTDTNKAVTVTDYHMVFWDISGETGKSIISVHLEGKNNPKFTNGKWNPHQNCNQVSDIYKNIVLKNYDCDYFLK